MDYIYLSRFLCPWNFLDNNIGVDCHFLLQGIFPTEGSNCGLLRWQWILLTLSQLGSPVKFFSEMLISVIVQQHPWSKKLGNEQSSLYISILKALGSPVRKKTFKILDPEFPESIGSVQFSSVSCSVMSDSLRPHGLQHTRLPCPSPTPGAYSNSCPLSRWHHPTISSSVVPFSSSLQSFPASGSFQMSQFFISGGQSIGVSA